VIDSASIGSFPSSTVPCPCSTVGSGIHIDSVRVEMVDPEWSPIGDLLRDHRANSTPRDEAREAQEATPPALFPGTLSVFPVRDAMHRGSPLAESRVGLHLEVGRCGWGEGWLSTAAGEAGLNDQGRSLGPPFDATGIAGACVEIATRCYTVQHGPRSLLQMALRFRYFRNFRPKVMIERIRS
jgi:hypothetical protein